MDEIKVNYGDFVTTMTQNEKLLTPCDSWIIAPTLVQRGYELVSDGKNSDGNRVQIWRRDNGKR